MMTLSSDTAAVTEPSVEEVGAQLAELFEPSEAKPAREPKEKVAPVADSDETGDAEAADEAEADAPDESDEAEEGADDPENTQTFTVKIGDEEKQVSLEDLTASYQREADYHQKTEELTGKAQAYDHQVRALGEWEGRLKAFAGLLQAQLKEEADPEELARLKDEDPGLWAARMQEIQQKEQLIQTAATNAQRIAQVQARQQQQQLEAIVEEEHGKLLKAVPEWKDQAKARTDTEAILSYLADAYGVTPEDLSGVYDHRWVLLARKAMLYDKAAKRAPAVADQAKGVLKAGAAGQRTGVRTQIEKSAQRLAQTGSVEDAGSVFANLFS